MFSKTRTLIVCTLARYCAICDGRKATAIQVNIEQTVSKVNWKQLIALSCLWPDALFTDLINYSNYICLRHESLSLPHEKIPKKKKIKTMTKKTKRNGLHHEVLYIMRKTIWHSRLQDKMTDVPTNQHWKHWRYRTTSVQSGSNVSSDEKVFRK